jgi:hypothetical protein
MGARAALGGLLALRPLAVRQPTAAQQLRELPLMAAGVLRLAPEWRLARGARQQAMLERQVLQPAAAGARAWLVPRVRLAQRARRSRASPTRRVRLAPH